MFHRKPSVLLASLVTLLSLAGSAAHAQCPPGHLIYLDLVAGVSAQTSSKYLDFTVPLQHNGNTACAPDMPYEAVVKVTVPPGCHGAEVWLDYANEPHGWTVNIGDSDTNNGFGGDAGSLPRGQNAEVQILDQILSVYTAADNAPAVDTIATQSLALTKGAIRFEVGNQSLSWGQPLTTLATPDLEQLFFLPTNPVPPENRTFYVGLNRTISSPNRNGCGLRRAMVMFD